jgi:hypothetical protein
MSKVADGGNALCFLFRRLNFLCFRVLVSFQCVVSVKRVTLQSVCKVFFCSLRIANCYGKFGHHVWRCNLTKVNDRVFFSFLSKKAGHPAHHRHPACSSKRSKPANTIISYVSQVPCPINFSSSTEFPF